MNQLVGSLNESLNLLGKVLVTLTGFICGKLQSCRAETVFIAFDVAFQQFQNLSGGSHTRIE